MSGAINTSKTSAPIPIAGRAARTGTYVIAKTGKLQLTYSDGAPVVVLDVQSNCESSFRMVGSDFGQDLVALGLSRPVPPKG